MSASLRSVIFILFGALWASGLVWLILHEFWMQPSDFGPSPNPWEPSVLRLHGWIAVAGVFMLGWIASEHISDRWPQLLKRTSGLAIASVALVLALSGYALYYTSDRLHDGAAVVHEIVGVVAIAFALVHWRRHRRGGVARSSVARDGVARRQRV